MRIAIHDYAGHPFVFDLSRQLAATGHRVRHFFFEGDLGPKGAGARRPEDPEGFDVEPISIGAPYRKELLLKRRGQDIEYGRNAAAAIEAFAPDVVISGNTPLEAQGPIMAATRRVEAGFVFWVQDLYSLAVRHLLGPKFMGAGALASFWYERLETTLLSRSDAIVAISDDFLPGLKQLRVDHADIEVIPNWGSLDAISPRPKRNAWSEGSNLGNHFVFLYSGTLGLKHDPMLLSALADAFRDDPAVRVVVAAVGAGMDRLKLEAEIHPRTNLILKGLEPIETLADCLGGADVMVALLEGDAGRYSVPSKVLSYLCAGRPTLLAAPSENLSSRILTDAQAGFAVPAGDVDQFIQRARELRAQDQVRSAMGASARTYAQSNFDIRDVAARFETVLERAALRAGSTLRQVA